MPHLPFRRSLVAAAVVGCAAACAPAAGAATVTLSVSTGLTYAGGSVTATVTSQKAGTVTFFQLRSAAQQGGAGRCFVGTYGYVGSLLFQPSRPVATVSVAAGRPVSVRLAGSALQTYGGNLLDSLYHPNPDACTDPLTQFTKLGAFFDLDPSFVDDQHDIRSLTRVL